MRNENVTTLFSLHPSSGVPIYRQVVDQVRAHVAGGHLKPGDFVPSVRQVATGLTVNPMTVSKAYSLLETEGVLERVRGQGMRVSAKRTPLARARDREDELLPLLEQVVVRARQLSLSPAQIGKALRKVLKEKKHEKR